MRIIVDYKTSQASGNFGSFANNTVIHMEGRKKWVRHDCLRFETSQHNISVLLAAYPEAQVIDQRDDAPLVRPERQNISYDFKMKPLDFQFETFNRFKDQDQFALFSVMGSGKSKCVIDIASYRAKRGTATGMIVLSIPKGVHFQWVENQLPAHFWNTVPLLSYAWDGKVKWVPNWIYSETEEFQIFSGNLDMVRGSAGFGLLKTFAEKHGKNLIICIDESDSIKTRSSQRHRAVIDLAQTKRVIMSGTPIAKDLTDEWAQFYFLNPDIIGHKFQQSFRAQYCVMGGFENKQVIGHKNIDKFKQLTAPYIFRATKEDLNLPEKIYDEVVFELTATQLKHIKEIKTDFFSRLDSGEEVTAAHGAAAVVRVQQISNGFVMLGEDKIAWLDNPRLDVVRDVRRRLLEPVVVWARFKEDVRILKEEFGNDAVVYYGETSAEDRATAKELFIRGDVPIFIATAAAAGRGVDGLQKICSDAIYYSQSYNAIERWQSEDRTNRIGSKHTSSYITLIGRGGADRSITRHIPGKTALSDLVLDGKAQVKNSLADAIDIMRGIG